MLWLCRDGQGEEDKENEMCHMSYVKLEGDENNNCIDNGMSCKIWITKIASQHGNGVIKA